MGSDPVAEMLAAYPVIHHAVRRHDEKGGGRGGVSAHQATVLSHLHGYGGRTLTELAGVMGVALPTMSLLIDRLVRSGFVRRDRDPADGRRVSLRLTDAGAKAARSRSLLDPARVRALLGTLTAAERSASMSGLATLARAAQRLAAPSSKVDRGRS